MYIDQCTLAKNEKLGFNFYRCLGAAFKTKNTRVIRSSVKTFLERCRGKLLFLTLTVVLM